VGFPVEYQSPSDLPLARLSHSSWYCSSNPLQFLQQLTSYTYLALLVTACSHYLWEALPQPGFILKSVFLGWTVLPPQLATDMEGRDVVSPFSALGRAGDFLAG